MNGAEQEIPDMKENEEEKPYYSTRSRNSHQVKQDGAQLCQAQNLGTGRLLD